MADGQPSYLGSVEILAIKARLVRKLSPPLMYEQTFSGFRGEYAAPEGKAFLVLHLETKPHFAKDGAGNDACCGDGSAVSFEAEHAPIERQIGACDPHGRFHDYPGGYRFSVTERSGRPGFDPVFVVPERTQRGTLTVGAATVDVALPEAVEAPIDPAQGIDVRIIEARVVSQIAAQWRLSHFDQPFVVPIVGPAKRYLLLTIVVRPKLRNHSYGFDCDYHDFGLGLNDGAYARPIGTMEEGFVTDSQPYQFAFEENERGEFEDCFNQGQTTLAFPLPATDSPAKLLYLGSPVADVAVPA